MRAAERSRLGLLVAVAVTAAVQVGCGSSSSNSSGDPSARLCQKLLDCGAITADLVTACQQATKSMEMYVVDPAAAGACLSQLDCTKIQDQASIQQCLAYDTATFHCNGGTLHFCNTSAQCKDLDCYQACRQFYPSTQSATCSFDAQDQHDKCFCYL